MHKESFVEMGRLIREYAPPGALSVADLGSWSYGGRDASYRLHMQDSWEYVGLDIRGDEEHNVDLIMPSDYVIPFPDGWFDLMISGSTLEHVKNPWRLAIEIARVVKPGGTIIFGAPFIWPLHDKFDGYRFAPKGMRALFADAGFKRVTSHLIRHDHYVSAYLTDRQRGVEDKVADCWYVGRRNE
jgi:SAM-dependent methyltransferase